MQSKSVPIVVSLIFLVIFLIPVFYLIIGSFIFEEATSIAYEKFREVLLSPTTGSLIINSLIISIGGSLLSSTLGTIFAWIMVRTDVPGKRVLGLLPILALTMPFLVKGFGWMFLLSPQIGLINLSFMRVFGVDWPIFDIYTYQGLIFAMGTGGVPLIYLTVEPAIRSLDPALEEASRVAGRGLLKTLFKVTIPVLFPAILSAFLLDMIISLESFDYPFLLGNPAGIKVLATEVYFWMYQNVPPRYGTATILSIIYVIIMFVAFSLYIWVTRKAYRFVVVTGHPPRQTIHKLGMWKYVALAVCLFVLSISFLLPFLMVLIISLKASLYTTIGGGYFDFTLGNYIKAISLPLFWQALSNAIVMSVTVGIVTTLIAVLMSYATLKSKVKHARLIEYVSSIPLGFPGIVYGLALFWTFLLLPGISDLIYGTIWPLVMALIFVRLPYSVKMVSGNLIQVGNELEESSRVSGASWERTMRKILLPLLKKGMLNSFIYTCINSIRELGAIILLVTSQSIVITVLLLNLYSQHAAAMSTVAAASVIITIIIIGMLVVLKIYERLSARS